MIIMDYSLHSRWRITADQRLGGLLAPRRLIPHPAGVPAQHRVLVPEHQELGVLRPVPAKHQRDQPV